MDFDTTIKGALGTLPGSPGTNQELSFLSMSGSFTGKNSHLVLKGFIATFLGGDPTKGLETMNIDGKTYIRGPVAMLGAPEDKWYVSTSQAAGNLPRTDTFIGKSSTQNVDWNIFKKTGTETFDNRRCDVYTGDKHAAREMFTSLDLGGTTNLDTLDQLDNAEIKFWVCDDGYMHQMLLNMEAHDAKKPTDKITLQLRLHLYDFGANIKLTPPPNPAPLQMPLFSTTPTKTQ